MTFATTMRAGNNHQMVLWMGFSICKVTGEGVCVCVCVWCRALRMPIRSWRPSSSAAQLCFSGFDRLELKRWSTCTPACTTDEILCLCDRGAGTQQRWPTCRLDFQRRLWQLSKPGLPLCFKRAPRLWCLPLTSPVILLKTEDRHKCGGYQLECSSPK